MACDCNRCKFLPKEWLSEVPEDKFPCRDTIRLKKIIPIDPQYPTLDIDEWKKSTY